MLNEGLIIYLSTLSKWASCTLPFQSDNTYRRNQLGQFNANC